MLFVRPRLLVGMLVVSGRYSGIDCLNVWEDSGGDGVFNIQELLIGKNPSVRDVLGIHLRVCLKFPADDLYLSRLKRAFYLASRYIYDYTDGYAFISSIEIYNNSPEYNSCDVIVELDVDYLSYATGGKVYIEGGLLCEPPTDGEEYTTWQRIRWFAAILGHELGHTIFLIDDEYKDENGTSYNHSIGNILWLKYNITTVHHLGNPSFGLIPVYEEIDVKELSWYEAYLKFWEIWPNYPIGYVTDPETGEIKYVPTTNITAQWSKWTANPPYLKYGFAWYSLVYLLTQQYGMHMALYIDDSIYVFTNCAEVLTQYRPLELPELVIWPKIVVIP